MIQFYRAKSLLAIGHKLFCLMKEDGWLCMTWSKICGKHWINQSKKASDATCWSIKEKSSVFVVPKIVVIPNLLAPIGTMTIPMHGKGWATMMSNSWTLVGSCQIFKPHFLPNDKVSKLTLSTDYSTYGLLLFVKIWCMKLHVVVFPYIFHGSPCWVNLDWIS